MTETNSAAPVAALEPVISAPETPTTSPETLSDPGTVITTEVENTEPLADKDAGGLIFPDTEDAEAILNFRKACGYPDEVAGYGLAMESDEQKDVLNFIHRCQLDKVAAKTVVENLAVEIAEQEKKSQAQYNTDYAKIVADWGDNKKANENYLSQGLSMFGMDKQQLKSISEHIGVEAALKMMTTLGKLNSDHSGVGGGGGSDRESVADFIAGKRQR